MAQAFRTRDVTVVRVNCPISPDTLTGLLAGDMALLDRDDALAKMFGIIGGDNPLGDFGIYKSVVKVEIGWELFTPTETARPALGASGAQQISPTATLTIHVGADASPDALDAVLAALLEAHPWEVPVIDVSQARLLLRD